ncbi:FCD domain-containing protein [Paenibacillus rigui]
MILAQHQEIVHAIKEKDPDKAERVLREHLERVIMEKEQLLQTHASYFKA